MMDKGNVLLVVGSFSLVDQELEKAKEILVERPFDILAVGLDSCLKYSERVEFMATYHPKDINPFLLNRRKLGGNTDYKVISHLPGPAVDIVEPLLTKKSGSSALLGVLASLKLGYEYIILCGCPLIGCNSKSYSYEGFQKGWIDNKQIVIGKVKSMSGWTKEFLGFPSLSWLDETNKGGLGI